MTLVLNNRAFQNIIDGEKKIEGRLIIPNGYIDKWRSIFPTNRSLKNQSHNRHLLGEHDYYTSITTLYLLLDYFF